MFSLRLDIALESRGCVLVGWREPARSDDDNCLNFCGKCERKALASASTPLSLDRVLASGRAFPLGRRCDVLLLSFVMMDNRRWCSDGKVQGSSCPECLNEPLPKTKRGQNKISVSLPNLPV